MYIWTYIDCTYILTVSVLVTHWIWSLSVQDNWALMRSWHEDAHKIPCTWTYIHTCDQVRLTYTVHMHWVNFHSTQTIFSCLAEGRTNCWPEPGSVTAQPLMWQRRAHTHTHARTNTIVHSERTLPWGGGWDKSLLSLSRRSDVHIIVSGCSLSPCGYLDTKTRSVWPSDTFNDLLLHLKYCWTDLKLSY